MGSQCIRLYQHDNAAKQSNRYDIGQHEVIDALKNKKDMTLQARIQINTWMGTYWQVYTVAPCYRCHIRQKRHGNL
jgi:hypothetical protein